MCQRNDFTPHWFLLLIFLLLCSLFLIFFSETPRAGHSINFTFSVIAQLSLSQCSLQLPSFPLCLCIKDFIKPFSARTENRETTGEGISKFICSAGTESLCIEMEVNTESLEQLIKTALSQMLATTNCQLREYAVILWMAPHTAITMNTGGWCEHISPSRNMPNPSEIHLTAVSHCAA